MSSTPDKATQKTVALLEPSSNSPLPKRIIAAKSPDDGSTDSKKSVQLSTSKVWVLPPRPKPGRKPASDTPPCKRKAQNREAQRAFRERRAAVINDLEGKITLLERAHASQVSNLNKALAEMKKENEKLRGSLSELHLSLAKQHSSYQVASPAPSESMELLDRVLNEKLPVLEQSSSDICVKPTFRCAICTKDECLCETIQIKPRMADNVNDSNGTANNPDDSNTTTNNDNYTNKRLTEEMQKEVDEDEKEIDFTAQFARPQKIKKITRSQQSPAQRATTKSNSLSLPDLHTASNQAFPLIDSTKPEGGCGFCSKDTPCVCEDSRDEARQEKRGPNTKEEPPLMYDIEENTLPPIISPFTDVTTNRLPALHPGPTREVASLNTAGSVSSSKSQGASTFSSSSSSSSSSSDSRNLADFTDKIQKCTGNPGSCSLCQRDPMSTLFCSTIASRDNSMQQSRNGTYISVSAAYQTLSRHKDFRSANFGQLVSELHTRGMEVEVNSVANVLRQLDRRLYD